MEVEEPKYVLALGSDLRTSSPHFKLEREENYQSDMICFNIMSSWYGKELEVPEKILVVVKAEEFEAVKNFLLTLRS